MAATPGVESSCSPDYLLSAYCNTKSSKIGGGISKNGATDVPVNIKNRYQGFIGIKDIRCHLGVRGTDDPPVESVP
jgi:hypothetical protein